MFKVDNRLLTDVSLTARAAIRNGTLGRRITHADLPTTGELAELYVHLENFGSILANIYCGRSVEGQVSKVVSTENKKIADTCYGAHSRVAASMFQLLYPGKRETWLKRRGYVEYGMTSERKLSGILYILINGLLGEAYGDYNKVTSGLHADILNSVCKHYFNAMGINLANRGKDNAADFTVSLSEWSSLVTTANPDTPNNTIPPVQKQLPAVVELLAKMCVDHLEDLMGGEAISLPIGRAVQYNNTLYITNSDVEMNPGQVDLSKLTVVTVDPSTME